MTLPPGQVPPGWSSRTRRLVPGEARVVVAVDWGGTWIRVALATADGQLLAKVRRPRPRELAGQIDVVTESTATLSAELGVRPGAAGVGIAGITRAGVVESAMNIGITQPLDLAGKLRAGTGLPVTLVNDTQAAAVAEAAALGPGTHVLLTVGTGIGGAIVAAGKLAAGNGAAGDFGHMVVAIDGPDCPCGGRGCLEQLVCGRVLDLTARRLAETGASPWLMARAAARGRVHAGDMDAAARAGDPAARAALADAASALLAGLRSITAAIDPDVMVLGGGLLRPRALLTGLVTDCWSEQRPRWSAARLQPAAAGAEAGLRGAALLAAQQAGFRQ